jgi:hypothetical protein
LLVFLVLNCLNYFILTIDYRATAQGNILWSIVSNFVIALLTFTIIKKIEKAESFWDRVGYAVGGTLGNVAGILATKALWHQ